MSDMNHVYVTAHGSYPSGAWVGEAAQIGMRLGFAPTLTAPLKGDIWTPSPGGAITPDFGTQAGTNGTLAKTWTARIGSAGSDENMDANAQIDMAEDVRKFLDAIKGYQTNTFRWTHIKVSAVDALGKTPIVSSVYTLTVPIVGTSAGSALPPQIAMALSTRANLVGRRGRGRIYVPAVGGSALGSDGTISATPNNSMRSYFKTLIDDLQNVSGTPDYIPLVVIMSAGSLTGVRPVEVRTGDRFDTIRSRREQVKETYGTTAL